MPKRSNLFQEVIAIVQGHLNSETAVVTESKELLDAITGQPREIDICIEREVQGAGTFTIGIECRDHPNRKQTIEWVEQMFGKHFRLTNKQVLVSSSGFTAPALVKAKALGMHTITPASVENLREELVDRLDSVWAKLFRMKPHTIKIHFELEGGQEHFFETHADGGPGIPTLYDASGSEAMDGNDFLMLIMGSVPPDNEVFRDATGDERRFNIDVLASSIARNGQAIELFVHESTGAFRGKVVRVEVAGTFEAVVQEIGMSHASFDDIVYSHGAARLGRDDVLVVATQPPDGERQMGLRVNWGEAEQTPD